MLPQRGLAHLQQQIAAGDVHRHVARALEADLNLLIVRAGADYKVVLQLLLVAVIDHVHALVHARVMHAPEGRNVRVPLLRVIPDEVIDLALKLIQPGDRWLRACALQLHPQHGRLGVADCRLRIGFGMRIGRRE